MAARISCARAALGGAHHRVGEGLAGVPAGDAAAVRGRHGQRLQLIGGGMLVGVGLAIATGLWSRWMIALRPLIQGVELPI